MTQIESRAPHNQDHLNIWGYGPARTLENLPARSGAPSIAYSPEVKQSPCPLIPAQPSGQSNPAGKAAIGDVMLLGGLDIRKQPLLRKINSRGEPKLSAQAIQWPTPAAQNWKGSSEASITRTDGKSRMDILHYRAEEGFIPTAPVIMPDGRQSALHTPISRPLWASMIASHGQVVSRRILKARARQRLNPLFVGWLMGWPIGHALCDCSATEFTLWQQRMRGALSQLPMALGPWIWRPGEGPKSPAQMNLFEGLQP